MSTNLSSRIRDFIKAEAVLVIAAVAAVASMAAFPLTPATLSTYIGYIDMRTIGLLFCLMTVVAGLGRAGLLNAIRNWLMTRVGSARTLAFILINVVFIAAMLVTNDVALITFVPLALALFMQASPRATIATVVAITVAANLGSICTPIGNPQNIFLVSAFSMDLGAFFATVLPVGALSYLCCIALTLLVPTEHLEDVNRGETSPVHPRLLALYLALFALCIACVGHAISWQLCCAAVAGACLVLDRRVFMGLDVSLLVAFICFFIFRQCAGAAAWHQHWRTRHAHRVAREPYLAAHLRPYAPRPNRSLPTLVLRSQYLPACAAAFYRVHPLLVLEPLRHWRR